MVFIICKKYFIGIGALVLAALMITLVIFSRSEPNLVKMPEYPDRVKLEYASILNYRQGLKECGPYAAAAAANALRESNIHPKKMVSMLPWKLPFGYTHPWALEQLLASVNLTTESYSVKSFTSVEKKEFLMQEISNHSPVILLVKMYGYQHYVVLLGFDSNTNDFFVYDPVYTRGEDGYTVDDNGNLPGNRNINWDVLREQWDEGGVFGFFEWYALVVEK